MRTSCVGVVLPLLALLVSSSLCDAENPAWNNLKQLSPGQQVRVVLDGKKSVKGESSPSPTTPSSSTPTELTRLSPAPASKRFPHTVPGIAGATRSLALLSERALALEPARPSTMTVLSNRSSAPATRGRPY